MIGFATHVSPRARWRGCSTPTSTIRAAAGSTTARDPARRRDQPRPAAAARHLRRPCRSFRSTASTRRSREWCVEQTGGRYALLNPGRGVAEQALAAVALRPARRGAARAARSDVGRPVGAGDERGLAEAVVAHARRRGGAVAASRDRRHRRARPRRRGDGVGRYRARRTSPRRSARRSSASTGRPGRSATVRGCRMT